MQQQSTGQGQRGGDQRGRGCSQDQPVGWSQDQLHGQSISGWGISRRHRIVVIGCLHPGAMHRTCSAGRDGTTRDELSSPRGDMAMPGTFRPIADGPCSRICPKTGWRDEIKMRPTVGCEKETDSMVRWKQAKRRCAIEVGWMRRASLHLSGMPAIDMDWAKGCDRDQLDGEMQSTQTG